MKTTQTTHTQPRPWYFAVIILAFIPFAGIGVDIYTPSLPWIQQALQVDPSLVKLTISIYLLGYAIGPLLFGVLADIHGRKPILILGLVLYLFTCIGIVAWQNITMMLVMRLLQGFAIGAAGASSKAMITDTYRGEAMRKMGSMMSTIWAIGPVIAPFLGGYLQHYYGWHANFYFLMVYAVVMLLASLALPETIQEKMTFKVSTLLRSYKTVLQHKTFWVGVILMAMVYSMIIIFNIVGPFYIQQILHFTPVQFGHVAFVMGLAFLLGGTFNRVMLNFVPAAIMSRVGVYSMLLFSVLYFVSSLLVTANLYWFTVPIFVIFFFSSFVFPAGMAKCLSLFPQMAGIANSLMSFLFVTMTAIAGAFASFLATHTIIPLTITYLALVTVCWLAYSLKPKC